ncbi:glycosyltransferase family 4 protein [Holophaga foetida]|uniref:glycosyltransferase family 4 protein n=1 Tax=Holophaga foetida TaxID=35839 RepID=UPI0002473F43|nr:glycosyltransferase family 4 protein [Holophaga foetida]
MPKPIKVLILAPYPKGDRGGAEVMLGYMEKILTELGGSVTIRTWNDSDTSGLRACLSQMAPLMASLIRTKDLPGYPKFSDFDFILSTELMGIGVHHPRHLHLFLGSYAGFRSKAVRPRGTLHRLINMVLIRVSAILERKAGGTLGALANSESLRDQLESFGVRVHPDTIMPPTDTERFTFGHQGDARRRLGLQLTSKLALFAGRWEYAKGMDRMEAIASMLPAGWQLLVATPKPFGFHRDNRPEILFRFDTAHADMPDLYRSADVLLLPSRFEGYPQVISEAQACGCPVVTCVEGPTRLLKQAGPPLSLGVVNSPDDPRNWVAAVEAISHPDVYPTVRNLSRAFVEKTSSLPVVLRQYHDLLSKLCSDLPWQYPTRDFGLVPESGKPCNKLDSGDLA